MHYLQPMAWGDLSVTEYGQHSKDSGGNIRVPGSCGKDGITLLSYFLLPSLPPFLPPSLSPPPFFFFLPSPSFFLETGFLNPSPGLILLSLRASFIPDSMRFPVVTGCQRTWEPQLPHQPVAFLTPAETPSLSCIFPFSELYLGAFHKPSTQWQHRVNAI